MDVYDFMGNSAAAVLSEVLTGVYEGLKGMIELNDDSAYLVIGDEDGSWILSLRRLPSEKVPVIISASTDA